MALPVTRGKGSEDVDAWDIWTVRGGVPVADTDAHKGNEEKCPSAPSCRADEGNGEGEECLLDESVGELVAGGGLRYAVEVGESDRAWGGFALVRGQKAVSALKIFEETAHWWLSILGVGSG